MSSTQPILLQIIAGIVLIIKGAIEGLGHSSSAQPSKGKTKPKPRSSGGPTKTPRQSAQTKRPSTTISRGATVRDKSRPTVALMEKYLLMSIIALGSGTLIFALIIRMVEGTDIVGLTPSPTAVVSTSTSSSGSTAVFTTTSTVSQPSHTSTPVTATPILSAILTPTSTLAATATVVAASPLADTLTPPPREVSGEMKPTIVISEPQGRLDCITAGAAFCDFRINGTVAGVESLADLRVFVFVYPENPSGCGWYLQKRPAIISASGAWVKTPAFIGNETYPAQTGHTLIIRAALVQSEATLNGIKLVDLPGVTCLSSVEDIDGLVALSDPASLTVKR